MCYFGFEEATFSENLRLSYFSVNKIKFTHSKAHFVKKSWHVALPQVKTPCWKATLYLNQKLFHKYLFQDRYFYSNAKTKSWNETTTFKLSEVKLLKIWVYTFYILCGQISFVFQVQLKLDQRRCKSQFKRNLSSWTFEVITVLMHGQKHK